MNMKRYDVSDEILNRCIAIALTQKRFMRSSLKQLLYDKCLYADLHQALVLGAVEAWQQGFDPDTEFRFIKNTIDIHGEETYS